MTIRRRPWARARTGRLSTLLTGIIFIAAALGVRPAGAAPAQAPETDGAIVGAGVEEALRGAPTVRVVVLLDVAPTGSSAAGQSAASPAATGPTIAPEAAGRIVARADVARARDAALAALQPGDLEVTARPNHAPIVAGALTAAGLGRLRRAPGALRVDLDGEVSINLGQSVPLVRADLAAALGFNGAGRVVGIVDTGVQTNHPDLANDIAGEACTCSGCCPVPGPGVGAAEDDNGHGTHVSGIITSDGHVAPRGVAPGAKIVMVKVLDSHGQGFDSDIISGLDWFLDNRPDVDAINVSIGSSATLPGHCDNTSASTMGYAAVMASLRAAGILTVVAAGNEASSSGMSVPACVSEAVSVGATYDASFGGVGFGVCTDSTTAADKVACFSNSDAVMNLFAPGGAITSSYLGSTAATLFGTSMAAPHAAACAALLRQAKPSLPAAAVETWLEATGHPVTDPRNGFTFPRIDCLAAIQARSCTDADGDGFWAAGPGCPGPPFSDCDDGDPARNPGAAEICDGKDNNCDGRVDEGFDPDADGLASCFDDCPTIYNPGQEDFDHDGQGDACDLDDGVIQISVQTSGLVTFQQETGFDVYDLYRGDLGALVDADHDGAADNYGSCLAENLPGPTFSDPTMPAVGHGFIYLVTGRTALGESSLGTASNGAPRPNIRDCTAVFGSPPVVHSVSVTTSAQQASCDLTTMLLGRVCTLGVPGAQASAPIVIQGGYTEARLESGVTDPDGTPASPDLASVTATLTPSGGGSFDVALLDDGSAVASQEPQRLNDFGEDCTTDPATCACNLRTYGVTSGDAATADTTFARVAAFVNPSLPAILSDCIMQQRQRLPFTAAPGVPIGVSVTAVDHAGHTATGTTPSTIVPGSGSYSCGGDACGCCLLTATNPSTQCRALAGLVAPGYPSGVCMSF